MLYFPLIGNDINQFVKLIDKDKFTLHDYFPFILDIRGRSGVGKTRLIKELADKAENHDCKVKQYDARKNKDFSIIKDLIAECFVLLHIIGKGSFGQIYISYNLRDNLPVSVKKEMHVATRNSARCKASWSWQNQRLFLPGNLLSCRMI